MLGMQEQAEHSLAALYASSSSTESNSERLIQKLTDEINQSAEIVDGFNVPSERLAGRAIIKETVARRLNELNKKRGASIQEVKDQIKAFTHDIEETSGSLHVRKEKGEQK
jgi:phosphoenolpyruvate carboxylase